MAPIKMTFTLDDQTAARLVRTAERLGTSKSGVVREAVREYAERVGRLSERERLRMLELFDEVVGRIPERPLQGAKAEIEAVRRARREAARRDPVASR